MISSVWCNFMLYRNVKVVAFGKAVLGMVAAVECILGDHIMEGVASIPVDAMETARENFPHYLPASNSKIRYAGYCSHV